MIRRSLICLLTLGLVACATQPKAPPSPPQASAPPPAPRPAPPVEAAPEAVQAPPVDLTPVPFEVARANFVRDTAAKYGIDPAQIEATLAQAQFKDAIVAAMSRPAERVKPWSEYRPMFISQARIDGGRAFLATHRDELQRVQARTGVPAETIVAIIGVETSYGKNAGSYRVLDALYTLAFRYPRSGDPAKLEREVRRELFFRDELGQLFALAREENLDITTLIGSYAGAMGLGQFMPSSYRQFAVDGDGDGKRNLFTDYDDAFSSIANYFVKKGGWVRDGLVAVPATLRPGAEEFNPTDWTPTYTLADLAARGYTPTVPVPAGATATPIALDGSAGKQYWLGFQNYYAITRYNNSKMYAMAVYQLSQAIAGKELPPA
ncbi:MULTISPECIES: lytic murein transglycosylase B [Xanthomonas]|uniref:lytic murein transglycosylase B n=1 Tax=Xanthomonas TaxID=338 RepID=UPI00136EF942|nr:MULTISPECIES: lytic murein transglycosylase B [Xanthomonas]MBB6367530.1 membrane-bound lytic murein transglycosylase B [Xanthomonas sp. F10]MCI2245207.1 lytic murein transglycosylase B [Xanthomonas indica]MXV31461.1 lytic murein transglycosylase B [Xanthomonas sp. LMG 8989]UYC12965.1 lytic murein transglycosylase B [Xanthomonas sp. CFBP 8445]